MINLTGKIFCVVNAKDDIIRETIRDSESSALNKFMEHRKLPWIQMRAQGYRLIEFTAEVKREIK